MEAVLKRVSNATGGLGVVEKSEEAKQKEKVAFVSYAPLLLRFLSRHSPTVKLELSVACLYEIQSFALNRKAKGNEVWAFVRNSTNQIS